MAARVDWLGLFDDVAARMHAPGGEGAADTNEHGGTAIQPGGWESLPGFVSTLGGEGEVAAPADAPVAFRSSQSSVMVAGVSPGDSHGIALSDEVAFIGGVYPDGTQPLYAFGAWNNDNPATYTGGYTNTAKWGAQTAGTSGGTVSYYFTDASNWSQTEKGFFAAGLALWSAVANVTFTAAASLGSAQIVFTRGSNGSASTSPHETDNGLAHAGETGSTVLLQLTKATITIDTTTPNTGFGPLQDFGTLGGYPIMTFLHEEGHAIGLGHAGPYNGNVNEATQQFSPYDTRLWSIMSYIETRTSSAAYFSQYPVQGSNWGFSTDGHHNDPTGLMPLDILAAQALYGAPTSTPLSGGQTFGFHSNVSGPSGIFFDFTQNTNPVLTLWDAGTNNTLDISGWSAPSTVNLNPGTFSSMDGMTDNLAIAFGTAIDRFVGGAGNDTVSGNNDGDTFTGGGGNDTFTGGTGVDTIVFSGNSASYTITDLGGGSFRITDNRAGSPDGSDLTNAVENAKFADGTIMLGASVVHPGAPDFNDDSHSDILWQNDNGAPAIWLMSGQNLVAGGTIVDNPGASWHIKAAGDFNADGKSDVLWQNDNGAPALWLMNGMNLLAGGTIVDNPGQSWHIVGTGDFNADGRSDIVWQNDSGAPALWLMNGLTLLGGGSIVDNPGPAWHIDGIGDFNGDGKSDILWQNDDGTPAIWEMNGLNLLANASLSNPGTLWHVKGTGDFNGDGKSDILLVRNDGFAGIWLMNGFSIVGGGSVGSPGATWHVATVEDLNNDGKSDIIWQNTDGTPIAWLMDGVNYVATSTIVGNPGASWHIVPSGLSAQGSAGVLQADDGLVFHFSGGHETVAEFGAGEVIDVQGLGVTDFADLQPLMSQQGADSVIAFSPDNDLTLHDVQMTQLTAGDFLFS